MFDNHVRDFDLFHKGLFLAWEKPKRWSFRSFSRHRDSWLFWAHGKR